MADLNSASSGFNGAINAPPAVNSSMRGVNTVDLPSRIRRRYGESENNSVHASSVQEEVKQDDELEEGEISESNSTTFPAFPATTSTLLGMDEVVKEEVKQDDGLEEGEISESKSTSFPPCSYCHTVGHRTRECPSPVIGDSGFMEICPCCDSFEHSIDACPRNPDRRLMFHICVEKRHRLPPVASSIDPRDINNHRWNTTRSDCRPLTPAMALEQRSVSGAALEAARNAADLDIWDQTGQDIVRGRYLILPPQIHPGCPFPGLYVEDQRNRKVKPPGLEDTQPKRRQKDQSRSDQSKEFGGSTTNFDTRNSARGTGKEGHVDATAEITKVAMESIWSSDMPDHKKLAMAAKFTKKMVNMANSGPAGGVQSARSGRDSGPKSLKSDHTKTKNRFDNKSSNSKDQKKSQTQNLRR